jgi:RNA-directed DNA polymerase
MRRHSDLLEPCAGKLASTVLRGEGDSNVPALPDYWSTRMGNNPEMPIRVSKLLKRQKGKCAHCGLFFREDDVMEADHRIPKSQGGKDSYDNWQLLHRHCHDTKTASDGSLGNKSDCNRVEPKPSKILEKVEDKWVMRYACQAPNH